MIDRFRLGVWSSRGIEPIILYMLIRCSGGNMQVIVGVGTLIHDYSVVTSVYVIMFTGVRGYLTVFLRYVVLESASRSGWAYYRMNLLIFKDCSESSYSMA